MSLAKNIEFLRRLPKLNGINGLGVFGRGLHEASPLVEVTGFGANPGDLRSARHAYRISPRISLRYSIGTRIAMSAISRIKPKAP